MNELEVKTEDHRIYPPNRGTLESEREQHARTTIKLSPLSAPVVSKLGNAVHLPLTHLGITEGRKVNEKTGFRREETIKVSNIKLAGVLE